MTSLNNSCKTRQMSLDRKEREVRLFWSGVTNQWIICGVRLFTLWSPPGSQINIPACNLYKYTRTLLYIGKIETLYRLGSWGPSS